MTPTLVAEIADNAPKIFPEIPEEGKSGSHRMIGPNESGRFWTIILLDKGQGFWRPITGWPSTNPQKELYKKEG